MNRRIFRKPKPADPAAPAPEHVHQHPVVGEGIFARVVPTTYRGPNPDRRVLAGKARRRARKAANAGARR